MVFDNTITVGNVAEVITLIGGGLLIIFRMGGDIRVMKADMANLKGTVNALTSAFDKLGTILTQVAVQDARLVAMEKRLDELAHGQGFIHKAIGGEWPQQSG